ncbi:MAG: hypothetical protein C0444_01045 [Microbacterium sp.]|nr:hypothetical protein [Microbacterium sp.]MBA4346758.1 hypothetical protein [Microbacterium sp.]
MADLSLRRSGARWWLAVVGVWAASRLVTTAIMLSFAARQGENAWTSANPGYLDFARLWDAHWYYIIAAVGYPSEIPRDENGLAGENAWAFMPVYPSLIRVGMALTGDFSPQGFAAVAVTISVIASLVATLLFFALAKRWLSSGTALLATALFCVAPLSPIMQVGYAESLHLALLFGALILVLDRRWVALPFVVTVMALTRPSGLAFAFMLALVWGWRWMRRHDDDFAPVERLRLGLAAVIAGFAGLAWPGIVALRTGDLFAYIDTELAWRRPYIGDVELLPFTPWFQGAHWWGGQQWWPGPPLPGLPWSMGEVLGPVILISLLILAGLSFLLPAMRRMPIELRFWIIAYSLYLLAVFFPQSSTFRLLVPLAPVLGAVALGIASVGAGRLSGRWSERTSLVVRVVLAVLAVALGIAGQVAWMHVGWWVDGYDFTPP